MSELHCCGRSRSWLGQRLQGIKQLITRVQAKTGYKVFTSFPCTHFNSSRVYYIYVNKKGTFTKNFSLLLVNFNSVLPFSFKTTVFHHTKKLPKFIARPPTWFPVKASLHCKQLIPNLKFLTTFNSSSFHTKRSIIEPGRGLNSETKVHKHCFQIEAKTKERFVGLSGF